MLKIPKKIEYALICLQVLNKIPNIHYSARQISENTGIPHQVTAKTLQLLMKVGIVESQEGIKGGYRIKPIIQNLSFLDFLVMIDEYPKLIECSTKLQLNYFDQQNFSKPGDNCEYIENCGIRYSMNKIQSKIENLFKETKLLEII